MPADAPNIVFFMLDQLSAKWLEADACPTPNIDRLRALGTSFSRAITSNPLCCPARATLATGLTTRGHGVLQNGYELDPALPTFMHILQGAGWRTGSFGKLHLLAHYHGLHPDYRPYGFDVVHNTEDARAGEWLDWVERDHPEHYEAALATVWPRGIPELEAYGPDKVDLIARIKGLEKRYTGHYTLPFPEEISQSAWITRHAVDFIHDTPADQPLLAHVSYVQPHSPFCAPAENLERVDADRIPEPIPPAWPDDPDRPACFRDSEGARRRTPDNWRDARRHYFADITHLDDQLGKVMAALEAAGRWENTYLIFFADHGELLMDHGFTGKGERHYDACVRVPLIIAGPGLRQGAACDTFVQTQDLCPTVLAMAGCEYPKPQVLGNHHRGRIGTLPGSSLLPWCSGLGPGDWRDAAYVESYNNLRRSHIGDWARTVRTAAWRYTLYPAGTGEQLFDLANDPDETRNLAADPKYADTRRELRDRLLELIIAQDYPHTPRERFAFGVH
ncbi:sulfatase-like hydrolase/transferase [bacterium]|nr:sulfatase-like hydrolase/transferase [bacterium]